MNGIMKMKKHMIKKVYKGTIFFLVLVILGILFLYFVPNIYKKHQPSSMPEHLDTWIWHHCDGTEEIVFLPQTLYRPEDSTIEIYTKLPNTVQEKNYLLFWTYFQTVHIDIDGENIYIWDNANKTSFGKASTSGWNEVPLPKNSAGKMIKIKMYTPYSNYQFTLDNVVCGTEEQLHQWMFKKYFPQMLIHILILLFAVFSAMLTAIQPVIWEKKASHFYFNIAIVFLAIWLIVGLVGYPIEWMQDSLKEFLAYLSFCTLSVWCTMSGLYLLKEKRVNVIAKILLILNLLNILVVFGAQAIGIKDIYELIITTQTLTIVTVFFTGINFIIMCYKQKKRNSLMVILMILILILSIILEYLQYFFQFLKNIDVGTFIRLCILCLLGIEGVSYFVYTQNQLKEERQIEGENKNLQMQLFSSQIEPHFILNVLGAIRTLTQPGTAHDALYCFSKYLRTSIGQRDYSKPISFREELDYINTYLQLEQLRFSDELQVQYQIETQNFQVLPLTIQPFVENAVKHGIFPMEHPGIITITVKQYPMSILVEIKDNGVGFNIDDWKKTAEESLSVGIKNAVRRLKMGMDAEVSITSSQNPENSGTIVHIQIPKKEKL